MIALIQVRIARDADKKGESAAAEEVEPSSVQPAQAIRFICRCRILMDPSTCP